MHFWIDKRSQTSGFGRARVAASLSGGGIGFGHHPRRIGGKSMVTPIHRYPAVDCRPHIHRQHHNNHHQQQQQQHQQQQNQHHHQQQQHHHQQQVHQQNAFNQSAANHQHRNNQHHGNQNNHHHHQQPAQSDCHTPLGQYGASHSLELEQGPLGIGPIQPRPARPLHPDVVVNNVAAVESQLLPSHLKCGMWASLALATVFVAGAKFYFDRQGTGLEVLIFCAFSATFFLAACSVSLCRRPRDLLVAQPAGVHPAIEHIPRIEPTHVVQHQTPIADLAINSNEIAAPPPPYHIAILLPENTKEPDESPPPSYDKLII